MLKTRLQGGRKGSSMKVSEAQRKQPAASQQTELSVRFRERAVTCWSWHHLRRCEPQQDERIMLNFKRLLHMCAGGHQAAAADAISAVTSTCALAASGQLHPDSCSPCRL